MTNEYQIRVVPEVAAQEDRLKGWIADEYGFDVRTIYGVRILKRSIDARQRQIFVNLKVRVYVNEQPHDGGRQATGDCGGSRSWRSLCGPQTDRTRTETYRAREGKERS